MLSEEFDQNASEHQQEIKSIEIKGHDNTLTVANSQYLTLHQTHITQISVEEVKTRILNETSPYKGLRKFETEDSDYFFGRTQCLKTLMEELEQTNFLLVLGASGSGKSSIVRAGLVPSLVQKYKRKESTLINLTFSPNDDPFESLYATLLQQGYRQSDAKVARRKTAKTLSQTVKDFKQKDETWLIFIDQFEEIFTTTGKEDRDFFVRSLVALSQEYKQSEDLKIIATMRSDFLDQFGSYPSSLLAQATNKHRPLMTDMHYDELRLAIEQPAARHGIVFEKGLVEEIIKDVQTQAGYLPLLQYTLDLLWKTERLNHVQNRGGTWADRTLRTLTYRELGGVRGALQQRVDQIYTDFSPSEKLAAKHIFLRLVDIGHSPESGMDWKPVRRRASYQEFSDSLEKSAIEKLVNANLLVSDASIHSDALSILEVTHEIVFTSWKKLNKWIDDNRKIIVFRNRLNDDAKQWQRTQSDDELWGGTKLQQAISLKKDRTFQKILGGFGDTATNFINISVSKQRLAVRSKAIMRSALATATLSATALFLSLGTPLIAYVLNDIGHQAYEQKQYDRSITFLEWSLKLKRNYALAHYNLGNTYSIGKQDQVRAMEHYDAAIVRDDKLVAAKSMRARSHLLIANGRDNNVLDAIALLEEALHSYFEEDDRYYKDFYQKSRNSILKNLGWAYLQNGDLDNAEQILNQAIQENKNLASSYCLLAQIFEEKGVFEQAQYHWQKCLKKGDPEHPDEKKWMEIANQRLNVQSLVRP